MLPKILYSRSFFSNGSGTSYAGGASYTANAAATLYAQWTITPAVGSYISYTGGDYTGKWVVLRNTTGAWEIISKESVGDLELSGATGYANAVKILNDRCSIYKNSTYAVSGRSVGATADSIEQIDTTQYPLTYEAARSESLPYHDTYYLSDQSIISGNDNLKHSSGNVWLASRRLNVYDNRSSFCVFNLNENGVLNSRSIYGQYSNGKTWGDNYAGGVRPVVTLKPGIRIIGGSGTFDNPYTISM